jgi:hypothetical protein
LIAHERRDDLLKEGSQEYKQKQKQYFELYWYQLYNHLKGCQIIVGNLIIPHQKKVPFEEKRFNEAIKDIEIVTGFIYIYDADISLKFASLKTVYGNELFKFPLKWDFAVTNKSENFNAETIHMPELRCKFYYMFFIYLKIYIF